MPADQPPRRAVPVARRAVPDQPPAAAKQVEYDPDDGVFVRRRPRSKSVPVWTWLATGGGLLGVAGLAVVTVVLFTFAARTENRSSPPAVAGAGPNGATGGTDSRGGTGEKGGRIKLPDLGIGGPSATDEGEKWTYRELWEYLKAKGLNSRMVEVDRVVCFVTHDPDPNSVKNRLDSGEDEGIVMVTKCADSQTAKEHVGRKERGGLAWGVFWVDGDPAIVSRIAALLK